VRFAYQELLAIGERAAHAASAGAASFAVPELAVVAETIAADARSGTVGGEAAQWKQRGASYHELLRLAAAYVVELEAFLPAREIICVPKVRAELEPMLALWPDVLALPTMTSISEPELIELRAFPIHPLGVVTETAWTDGRLSSPAEFFFHDLDHARFKVREDLFLAARFDAP